MIKHIITPLHSPPKGYTCQSCKRKAITGQPVVWITDNYTKAVIHASCMTVIVDEGPEMDEEELKAMSIYKDAVKLAEEFEKLKEEYARRL